MSRSGGIALVELTESASVVVGGGKGEGGKPAVGLVRGLGGMKSSCAKKRSPKSFVDLFFVLI